MLTRGKLSFGDALITVRRPSPTNIDISQSEETLGRQPDVKPYMRSTGTNNENDSPDVVVKITGIPGDTSVQMLSLFLENKKMSSGGVLRSLQYNGGVVALARFERTEGRLMFF